MTWCEVNAMRLQLRLLPSSPTISPTNCFVRLHPSTAQCLFNEALRIAHDKGISSSSSSSRRNEWRITNEEELLFLPLKISFQHDSSTSNENTIQDDDVTTMYVSYNGGSLNQGKGWRVFCSYYSCFVLVFHYVTICISQ